MKTHLLLSLAFLLPLSSINAQGIGVGGPTVPVPTKINFQGRVAVDNVNFEGNGQFKFALISTQSSLNPFVAAPSTILWTSDGSHLNELVTPVDTGEPDHYLTLAVAGGLYSVMLGDSAVPNNGVDTPIPMPALNPSLVLNVDGQPLTDLQLRVWFNDGTHGFQMLAPDQKLTSVVYAFRAAQAAGVDNNSITSDKLAFGAVTELKLANRAVTSDKIADFAITTNKINDGAITGIKLDAGSITESNLADGAISAAKLSDGAVTASKLGLGYAAGTIFDGVFTGASGPITTFTASFSSAMQRVPDVRLSGDWTLDSASISGFSASQVPRTFLMGPSVEDVSMITLDGLPALTYKDETTHALKFVTAADSTGASWNSAVDTGASGARGDFELAIIADRPAIAYVDAFDVVFAYPTNAARTTWATSLVSSALSGDQAASLADVGGRPAIAYRLAGKLTYSRSNHAGAVGFGSAPAVTVDATPGSASAVSLKMINGNPAIAYSVSGQEMRFVRASNTTGAAWNAPVSITGTGTSVAEVTLLTVNGRPAIACVDYTQYHVIYVRANDANGTSWPAAQVLAASGTLGSVSMSIVYSRPTVAFMDGGSLKLLQAVDADGSAWGTPVTQITSITSQGSIALVGEADGYVLAYRDNGFLKTTGQSLSWTASDGTVASLVAATAASVQSGGVGTTQLANGSVTMDKLDSAVLNSLLPGPGAITTAMLANGAVTASKIAASTITVQELADGAVTTDKLASEAVTSQELAGNSVNTNHLVNSAVTTAKIASGAVTAQELAAGAVHSAQLAFGAVTPGIIAAGAVIPSKISATGTFTFEAVSTGVLTITGGADVAEPFPTSMSDALEPGEVLIIDEDRPGHLKRSARGYDTRVAGIVSGAGGVKPGLTLRQHDVMEGSTQVALTGRVYVKADCSNGPIKPGDLITTSDKPGHGARASDAQRATGAIIGKAMSRLDDGDGLVLVLVSLQ